MTENIILLSFVAHDKEGNKYTIYKKQKRITIKNMRMPVAEEVETGLPWLETEEGYHVNHITKGHYRIIRGHEEIDVFSDDPNAP